ncbi:MULTISPECIES: hypothetical protein [Elizabethkingia]|uniref:Bacteriocin n=2 Tax=Elizabethkingia TaxID=308865 RepID=A0A7T7V340_9FLAO|nr:MULTISPECIES: hypothetical protein [Elizabethkingia]MCL1658140.1 hypothetical protein [Elizabethkingia miricola]MCP1253215.1 hypothetical protein [Elizabethkingia sp. S0634]MDQ8750992.1 hypothetical protein [Elizabethkingia miricola]MDX8572699.1 hypothetical protein [Elizabethkingia sp. HX QKY]NHQ65873.1 hypothetical protein [Elizabethkingia miricola]
MKKLIRSSLKTILGGKKDCRCTTITDMFGNVQTNCVPGTTCTEFSLGCAQSECWPTPIE